MNPEFQRNLWLELNPARLFLMPAIIALVLFVAGLGGKAEDIARAAQGLYFVIVAVWGSFKAARTVTDEVRDRTWDGQRMAGLSPASMAFGKLFGATIYCWYGGAIALAAFAAARFAHQPDLVDGIVADVVRMIVAGLLAHATALAASLAGARRRRGQARADAFLFFLAGMIAYWVAESLIGLASSFQRWTEEMANQPPEPVDWWGFSIESELFALASLTAFAALATLTVWRLMRVELQAPAQPAWYAGLVLFAVLWWAGLEETGAERAVVAVAGLIAATFVTAWIEPKDVVAWRAFARGGPDRAALAPATLTGLALAWTAAIVAALMLAIVGPTTDVSTPIAPIAGALFLTRDVALFAFFHLGERQKRGDFAAVLTIVLLYGLAPLLIGGVVGSDLLRGLFIVDPDAPAPIHLASAASATVQAAAAILMAQTRWRVRSGGVAPQPAPA